MARFRRKHPQKRQVIYQDIPRLSKKVCKNPQKREFKGYYNITDPFDKTKNGQYLNKLCNNFFIKMDS